MGITEQTESAQTSASLDANYESVVEADTLVEEISIDGMCGVY